MDFFSPKELTFWVNKTLGSQSPWIVKGPGVYHLCYGDRRFVLDCRTDEAAREIMDLYSLSDAASKGEMEKAAETGKVWLTLDNASAHSFYDWVFDNSRTLRALVPPKKIRPKRQLTPHGGALTA